MAVVVRRVLGGVGGGGSEGVDCVGGGGSESACSKPASCFVFADSGLVGVQFFFRVYPAYSQLCNDITTATWVDDAASMDMHKRAVLDKTVDSFFYPNGRTKKLRFDQMTDAEIVRILLRPPDWRKWINYDPLDPPQPLDNWTLADLVPTVKFRVVFSDSLQKRTRSNTDQKRMLEAARVKFALEVNHKGQPLFPNQERMEQYFHQAGLRLGYAQDPPDMCMFVPVGDNPKRLMTWRSARGTQTVESYHKKSNGMVGSDNLRPEIARRIMRIGNHVHNLESRRNVSHFCKRTETNGGHNHSHLTAITH